MRAPIELDLHLPNFNHPGVGPDAIFEKLVEIATTAERSGFTAVTVMDHYHQIPPVGPPERWMFEGNTILAGLAARTSTINLGLLVGGVTYRNPAQHAKITTTLDVISGGRAFHGIGAGWFEDEHVAYGYDFPPLKERFERLEDHLRIARAMFTEEQATVAGTHHSVAGAFNNPKPLRGDIPILVGGSGERKTLRLVARYADLSNLTCEPAEVPRKLDALAGHCADLGRDRSEIVVSWNRVTCIAPTTAEAEAERDSYLAMRGLDWSNLPEEMRAILDQQIAVGDPDTVGERAAGWKALGVDGITVSAPANGHIPERVTLLGETLAKIF